MMSIRELGTFIFQLVASTISCMQGKHSFAALMTSSACNTVMTLSDRTDISDKCRLVLHCNKLTLLPFLVSHLIPTYERFTQQTKLGWYQTEAITKSFHISLYFMVLLLA